MLIPILAILYPQIGSPAIVPQKAPVRAVAPTSLPTYAEIRTQIAEWKRRYPRLVHESVLGKTVEGRDIPLIRLSDDETQRTSEPGVLLMGGIHPREQQPPICLLTLADELLAGYGKDPRATHLLRDRQIYLIPILNVDGRLYDENGKRGGYGRDWRKNRAKNADGTTGVDLNRNFPVRWGGFRKTDPLWHDKTTHTAGNIYEGPSSLSEPESQALADFMTAHANDIQLFVDIHSPLRKVLFPQYLSGEDAERYRTLAEGIRSRQKKRPYPATKIKKNAEPEPGERSGNTGLSYTYAYYQLGIYGFNIEIAASGNTDEGASDDLPAKHYPPLRDIQAEYRANIREPLLYLLDAVGNLPRTSRGNVTLMSSTTDKPPIPNTTVAWTPTLSGAATFAVLTSESPVAVVQSELRRIPVTTGFTLRITREARPGTVIPMTLTVWDDQRRISQCHVVLTVADSGDTIRIEEKQR